MQKGSLLLCVASLGIAWVHASTTSAGYCCPQITVALGTEEDGTYTFLTEGNEPASDKCTNACLYRKDSNRTATYCFEEVQDIGSGQVQCEAISPSALDGPTPEELQKEINDLKTAVDNLQKPQALWCGYAKQKNGLRDKKILSFDSVRNKLSYSDGTGSLTKSGTFTPSEGSEGIYLITLNSNFVTESGQGVQGYISELGIPDSLFFWAEKASGGTMRTQVSAIRYVYLDADVSFHINLEPLHESVVDMNDITLCVSLVEPAKPLTHRYR